LARTEIRIAGFGGQGVITAGYILANAASIHDDKHAVMTQSYGPEARGGACRSDAIISDAQIDYPKTTRPDVLVAMSLDAFNKYNREVRDGGVVIYDEDLVQMPEDEKRKGVRYVPVPASRTASELGTTLVANIVMLGALLRLTGISSKAALESSIKDRFTRYIETNLKALDKGIELADPKLVQNRKKP
jgi:2-oxoglutarate ferredoxin oxidoreductase subunit gamma